MKKSMYKPLFVIIISLSVLACKGNKEKENAENISTKNESTDMSSEYSVDINSSDFYWKGFKPLKSHNGTIKLSSGDFTMKDNLITSGTFVIDMTSITDLDMEGKGKINLENHLKGTVEGKEGDFFNVTKYPKATFKVNGMKNKDGIKLLIGDLTIKDKTNSISIPITINTNGNEVILNSETFKIDRTKWGVNYGSKSIFDNLGDAFISDEMELSFNLKATKN